MAARTVDLVARGPCSPDPYDPASPAWALAAGIASWGDSVRVLHPPGPSSAEPPAGVESVPLEVPVRRPGAALEAAAVASAAGRQLRRAVDFVVRDPIGLGTILGAPLRRDRPSVIGVVSDVELAAYDGLATHQHPAGLLGRVDTWRDRRSVRRLERDALAEADRLFYDDPSVPEVLTREYGIEVDRLAPLPRAVLGGTPPERDEARRWLRLPLDVPVVAAAVGAEGDGLEEAGRVQEAFHRVRSLFVGARFVGVGSAGARPEPGVTWIEARDVPTLEVAFVAADVTLVAPGTPRFDPGAVLALRARSALLASPELRFPVPSPTALEVAPTSDPADLAAPLAELLADPARRRQLADAGERFADRFSPERVAATVTAERQLLAA